MIGDTFPSGNVPTQLAETVVVCIPKSDSPTSIMDFRPISFCTVISKQVSKILVNRIRPHLDTIIGPLQSSFISNRGTGDNAIIPQEIVHHMHKSGNTGYIMTSKKLMTELLGISHENLM